MHRCLGLFLPAPLLADPGRLEKGPLRQIGGAREDELRLRCPMRECLARASAQAGLEARPKPTLHGALKKLKKALRAK